MGLLVRPSEVEKQTSSMIESLQADSDSLESVYPQIDQFISEGDLDGQAWRGLKQQLTGHRSVIRGLVSANELAMADCESLSSAVSKVEEPELDEDELKGEIQQLATDITAAKNRKVMYRTLINTLSSLPINNPFLSMIVDYEFKISKLSITIFLKEKQKARFEKKLEILYELERATSDLYAVSTTLYDAAQEGINAIGKSWTGSGFNLPAGSAWQTKMDRSWHETLPKVIDRELLAAGWDKNAIDAYREQLKKRMNGLTGDALNKEMDTIYDELLSVGSPMYQVLYEGSKLSHEEKVKLVMMQMGAIMDQGGLQLTSKYKFDTEMDPNNDFLKRFSFDVQKTFPSKPLKDCGDFGREVHLFKGYIDKHNIDYLNAHYPDEGSDFERLLAYAKEFGIEIDYSTGASLHNRSFDDFSYTKNMKILLPNTGDKGLRMSEFIFDIATGNFVSQWDVYEKHKFPDGRYDFNSIPDSQNMSDFGNLANTESFNYGPSKGGNKVPVNQKGFHDRLDVSRPKDTDMRESTLEKWPAPDTIEKDGRYVDIVKEGKQDYDQWQKVPENERQDAYNEFVEYCRTNDNWNPGFAEYCRIRQYYQ